MRSVVPARAGRSLWPAAVWTGAGAAVVCATLGIVAVAICWLPVSDTDGRAASTIRAGLLTFLAALHGGVSIDGVEAAFLPLGLTLIVGLACWRAGLALADTAAELDERDPLRLGLAGLAQAGSFTIACLVLVPAASLGTSSAPFLGVAAAGLLLSVLAAGGGLVWGSPLRDEIAARVPARLLAAARAAVGALAVYAGAGALLVAVSLGVHHGRVDALSGEVGGGWGAVPVLLLGLLAVPNAVIAGASYLAGPGFAVGAGTSVSPFAVTLGTVPAFPLLGALPDGDGATAATWLLVAVTPVGAGAVLALLAGRQPTWAERLRVAGAAVGLAALALVVLGWRAGGGIGDGALATIGPSPLWLPLAVAGELLAVCALAFTARAGWAWLHSRRDDAPAAEREGRRLVSLVKTAPVARDADPDEASGADSLAG